MNGNEKSQISIIPFYQVRRLGIPKMEEVGVSYSKSERGGGSGGGDTGKKGMDILKDSQVRGLT